MGEIDPIELAKSLGEIPLFRELQRLLTSQSGPVNWEIARQLARAVAKAGSIDRDPSPKDVEGFEEVSRNAELHVIAATGLEPSTGINEIAVLDRVGWADTALRGFEPLIERLATGLRGGSATTTGPIPISGILDALTPLLLGVQVGFLSGYLSRRVLGQYDLCYPTGEAGRLYYVFPNIVALEDELGVDPQQFRLWLALHEVTHQLEFQSIAWTRPYFLSLIERFIDSAEVDSAEVAERLRGLADPEQLSRLLERPNELLPILMTPAQESILAEIQAFMSVLEGFAEWSMNEVGKDLLPDFDKMREGMNRRRAERSPVEKLLEQLLGLDLKLEQYRAGEKFVTAVAQSGRLDVLWVGPSNLPSLEEVTEPGKWLDRIASN